MTIAAQVRTRREAIGLSRARLAVASGVSPSTIARLELTGHVPKLSALNAIADALGTSVSALIESETQPKGAA